MIRLIAQHRFLSNILNLRFTIAFVLCQVLFAASSFILTHEYVERLERYRTNVTNHEEALKNYTFFSELEVGLDRYPSPLSIISEGADKRIGESVSVAFNKAPLLPEAGKSGNPLLVVFSSLDLSKIIEIVLSLLVIFLVYNVISGERENGTLKQILSNDLPRYTILLGNFIGGMVSIAFPLLAGLLVSLLIMNGNPLMNLTAVDYIKTGMIALLALLYLSAFYLLGMFLSTRIRRSATVLTLLLFIWVVSVIILPNAAVYVTQQIIAVPDKTFYDNNAAALRKEWEDEMHKYRAEHPPEYDLYEDLPRQDYHFIRSIEGKRRMHNGLWAFAYIYMNSTREIMEWYYHGTLYAQNLRMDIENRIWDNYRNYHSRLNRQASCARFVSLCSPSWVFSHASSVIAGTSEGALVRFINRASAYRDELIRYMKSAGGFDYRMFTGKPVSDFLTLNELLALKKGMGDKAAKDAVMYDVDPLDLSDMPRFTDAPLSLGISISDTLPEFLTMMFLNVLFFLLSWASFLRSDIR